MDRKINTRLDGLLKVHQADVPQILICLQGI